MERSEILEHSITNFIKFGSKRFTLDELAKTLGISKKTIYKYFGNKEDLVHQGLEHLFERIKNDMLKVLEREEDPISGIIKIYGVGLEYLKDFRPSFIFGLKKYYPKAYRAFEDFHNKVLSHVRTLLIAAKTKGMLREGVDPILVCDLYFTHIENITFKAQKENLFEEYSTETLLNHLTIYNLRGIVAPDYKNALLER